MKKKNKEASCIKVEAELQLLGLLGTETTRSPSPPAAPPERDSAQPSASL